MDYNKKKCIEHCEFFNILKILTQTFFHLTRRILGNALKPRKRHFQNEKNGHFFTFPSSIVLHRLECLFMATVCLVWFLVRYCITSNDERVPSFVEPAHIMS